MSKWFHLKLQPDYQTGGEITLINHSGSPEGESTAGPAGPYAQKEP